MSAVSVAQPVKTTLICTILNYQTCGPFGVFPLVWNGSQFNYIFPNSPMNLQLKCNGQLYIDNELYGNPNGPCPASPQTYGSITCPPAFRLNTILISAAVRTSANGAQSR